MGLGDFVTNLFGSKNKAKATGYNVDSNAYQYGGQAGGAENAANLYQNQAQGAQHRQAQQAQTVGLDYGQADADRAMGQQARQGQASLANIMSQRAQGLAGPSVAQQQADRQMQQSMAQQAALAGSARGAGGLAAAQRNAAFNNANAASDISGQAQINAANERRDDTNAAAGMYANLRGGDLASQGQSAAQAQAATQLAAQQNQFNAGLRDAQAGRDDQMQMGYEGLAQQTRLAQLGTSQNQQAQQSSNTLGAQGINAGVGGQNASMNQANAMNLIGFGQSALGVGAGALGGGGTPPGRAKGGPIGGAKPYLVGEQGPELVVPRHDGYVLTADQTRAALGGSPAATINRLFDRGNSETRSASLAGIMGARAEGGPIEAGTAAPPPAAPPPGYQPPISTWGTGQPDATGLSWDAAQRLQAQTEPYDALSQRIADQRTGIDATAARVNQSVSDIDAKDKDAIWNADYKDRHGQQLSKDEQDAESEARYRQDLDKKDARAQAKAGRKRTVGDILGDMGKSQQQAAASVDTAYHGGGGHYIPPQLIPLSGARAGGGPISAGGLVPLGPQLGQGVGGGIELGPGGGITHNDLLRAGSGLGDPNLMRGEVGGGGIVGGLSMGGHPIPGTAGAREDGGPVEGSEDKQKRIYTYDASRPFGDRFVDSRARPAAEEAATAPTFAPSHKLRRMDPVSLEHSQQLATEMGAGPDAVRERAPWEEETPPAPAPTPAPAAPEKKMSEADEHKAAANELLQKAALQTLLSGAGTAAPVAAAGIAHLINSYFSRRGGK